MNKSFLLNLFSALLVCSALVLTSCDNDDDDNTSQTITELANSTPQLSTLAAALEQTNLDATLSQGGSLTVFAPSNQAFQNFLTDNNLASLDDVPDDLLTSVLLYHVLGGEIAADDILQPSYISSGSPTSFGANINGTLFISNPGTVNINGVSNVTNEDINASNGIVHIVDEVIPLSTVVTFPLADSTFSSLVAALTRPDLTTDFVSVLTGDGPFTVFAPTNQAFEDLLNSNPDWNNLDDIPAAVLEKVLLYHVTDAGNVRGEDLVNGQTVSTLAPGETFTINLTGATPAIDDASGGTSNIIFTNVQAFNGVVHVVDRVLLPIL